MESWLSIEGHPVPELPDVEGFRRVLAKHAQHNRIERVQVLDKGVLRNTTPQALGRALKHRTFAAPDRRGKWLLARTDGPTVLLHFGMTGELHWCPAGTERHRHDRVVFQMPCGELRYRDMRKLKGLWLGTDETEVQEVMNGEGPDALGFSRDELAALLGRSRKQLKSLLTDQSAIAGLGNLLVDEILWQAQLHPSRVANRLGAEEIEHLNTTMRRVLKESVRAGRVPGRSSWLTGSREGLPAPCPRCGTKLVNERRGGRSTVLCPKCQER